MRDVLDRLVSLARVQVEICQHTEPLRAADTPALRADAGKLRRETGWAPTYSLDETLRDTLEYWRSSSDPREKR